MGDKSPTCQSHVDSADKAASESTQQVEQDVNCRYKLTLDETEWHQCPFRSNVRTCGRLTYAALIATALKSAPEHELTLPEIYQFLVTHKTMIPNATCRSSHWKGSVRYNLSVRPCFKKSPRSLDSGKQLYSIWKLDEEHVPAACKSVWSNLPTAPDAMVSCWRPLQPHEEEGIMNMIQRSLDTEREQSPPTSVAPLPSQALQALPRDGKGPDSHAFHLHQDPHPVAATTPLPQMQLQMQMPPQQSQQLLPPQVFQQPQPYGAAMLHHQQLAQLAQLQQQQHLQHLQQAQQQQQMVVHGVRGIMPSSQQMFALQYAGQQYALHPSLSNHVLPTQPSPMSPYAATAPLFHASAYPGYVIATQSAAMPEITSMATMPSHVQQQVDFVQVQATVQPSATGATALQKVSKDARRAHELTQSVSTATAALQSLQQGQASYIYAHVDQQRNQPLAVQQTVPEGTVPSHVPTAAPPTSSRREITATSVKASKQRKMVSKRKPRQKDQTDTQGQQDPRTNPKSEAAAPKGKDKRDGYRQELNNDHVAPASSTPTPSIPPASAR
eukprot:m.59344 g.59344  ORF g.59344 m.59344 type:complete len:555 (-) comp11766_c0_seq3:499-2163(-)